MATTEQYERRARAILRDLKRDDECMRSHTERNNCLGGLEAKCTEYIREAESLRALPKLNSSQSERLVRLEKIIGNMQGTLQKVR